MSQAYAQIQKATDYIRTQSNITPKLMLVLGSGLGDYGDRLQKMDVIPYQNIPGFPRTTVPGHKGNLLLGELFGVPVVIMQGRFHYYEGHRQQDIAFPVRVLRNLGAQMVLFTNAAGAINMDFKPGDLMMITDHINYSGMSPLFGENVDEMGPRFIARAHFSPRFQQLIAPCGRIVFFVSLTRRGLWEIRQRNRKRETCRCSRGHSTCSKRSLNRAILWAFRRSQRKPP